MLTHLPLTVPYRSERLGPERCSGTFRTVANCRTGKLSGLEAWNPKRRAQQPLQGTGKKSPGGAGTHTEHTRDTRDTRAHGSHRRTSQPSKPNDTRHARTTSRPRDGRNRGRALNTRSTAGPEPTAPRGRLRRGRPQRTRPSLHPLPDSSQSASLRLLEGGRRNEGARGPHYASSCARTPKSGQLVPAQRPTDGDACCARGRQIC